MMGLDNQGVCFTFNSPLSEDSKSYNDINKTWVPFTSSKYGSKVSFFNVLLFLSLFRTEIINFVQRLRCDQLNTWTPKRDFKGLTCVPAYRCMITILFYWDTRSNHLSVKTIIKSNLSATLHMMLFQMEISQPTKPMFTCELIINSLIVLELTIRSTSFVRFVTRKCNMPRCNLSCNDFQSSKLMKIRRSRLV